VRSFPTLVESSAVCSCVTEATRRIDVIAMCARRAGWATRRVAGSEHHCAGTAVPEDAVHPLLQYERCFSSAVRECVRAVREDEARRQENIWTTSQSRNVSVVSTYYFSFHISSGSSSEHRGQHQGKLLFTGCLK